MRFASTAHPKEGYADCRKCKYHLLERIDNNPFFAHANPDAVIDGVPYFVDCNIDRMINDAICILENLEGQPE